MRKAEKQDKAEIEDQAEKQGKFANRVVTDAMFEVDPVWVREKCLPHRQIHRSVASREERAKMVVEDTPKKKGQAKGKGKAGKSTTTAAAKPAGVSKSKPPAKPMATTLKKEKVEAATPGPRVSRRLQGKAP